MSLNLFSSSVISSPSQMMKAKAQRILILRPVLVRAHTHGHGDSCVRACYTHLVPVLTFNPVLNCFSLLLTWTTL